MTAMMSLTQALAQNPPRSDGRAHRRLGRMKPARRHKLQRIRRAIEDGRYDVEAKLDAILDRVLGDLKM